MALVKGEAGIIDLTGPARQHRLTPLGTSRLALLRGMTL